MTHFVRDYLDIRDKIKRAGNVCIYDMTIAGDGVGGVFACGFILSQMRSHIVNDTFHPYLFRYLCGSSVGSICIYFLLRIWYLYETNEDKELALELIEQIYVVFDFTNVRQVLATVDDKQTLGLNNMYKLFTNLLLTGGVMTRDGVVKLLRCDLPAFQKFKPFFNTREFDDWMRIHIENVFITVQSSETSISQIFTGNIDLFRNASKLIQFKRLTPGLLEHVVLCSSGIIGVFEPLKIDGNEFSCDGSSFVSNPMNVPYILHNFSYYNNVHSIFKPMLEYFEITSSEFIIHNDVLNIQSFFETIPTFASSSLNIIQVMFEIWMRGPRCKDAATHNYELSSIAYTQPMIADFSSSDANEIKGDVYLYNQSVLLQPEQRSVVNDIKLSDIVVHETITKREFETNRYYQINDTYENYCLNQQRYTSVVCKNPLSTYIYDSRCFAHNATTCHLVDTNTFVRHLYPFDVTTETIKVIMNDTTNIEYWKLCKNMGVIQSNVLYNIYLKRMNLKWNTGNDTGLSAIIQNSYNKFLGFGGT